MGLAPYGKPKHVQAIYDHLIDLKPDGTFRLNMDYFNYCTGLTMTSGKFDDLFGGPPRKPESNLTHDVMNIAREPIVCTPEDAYRCFMRSAIDILVLENCVVYKAEQKSLVEQVNW
jgi:predicted NodU family carbamoyl transferase